MGGKNSTSTNQVSIPPQVLAQYNAVNANAASVASTPFQQYSTNPNAFVAPLTAEQNQGISATNQYANSAQPFYGAAGSTLANNVGTSDYNAATGLAANNVAAPLYGAATAETVAGSGQANASQLNGSAINQYLSPYLGDVYGSALAGQQMTNAQQASQLQGSAIGSGAFGGDRSGIAQANLAYQQNLANNQVNANTLNTGYQTALGTAQQQQGVNLSAEQANLARSTAAGSQLANIGTSAEQNQLAQAGQLTNTGTAAENAQLSQGQAIEGLGTSVQQQGLAGAQAEQAAGATQQTTEQQGDTALYNQFLQQQAYPFQTAQFMANIAEGTGALSGTTTTSTQPSSFFSDKRLKENIKVIGKTYDGQKIYKFNYKGEKATQIGFMAQDVEKKHPEAVGSALGYRTVDYDKATEKAAKRGHFDTGGGLAGPDDKQDDGGVQSIAGAQTPPPAPSVQVDPQDHAAPPPQAQPDVVANAVAKANPQGYGGDINSGSKAAPSSLPTAAWAQNKGNSGAQTMDQVTNLIGALARGGRAREGLGFDLGGAPDPQDNSQQQKINDGGVQPVTTPDAVSAPSAKGYVGDINAGAKAAPSSLPTAAWAQNKGNSGAQTMDQITNLIGALKRGGGVGLRWPEHHEGGAALPERAGLGFADGGDPLPAYYDALTNGAGDPYGELNNPAMRLGIPSGGKPGAHGSLMIGHAPPAAPGGQDTVADISNTMGDYEQAAKDLDSAGAYAGGLYQDEAGGGSSVGAGVQGDSMGPRARGGLVPHRQHRDTGGPTAQLPVGEWTSDDSSNGLSDAISDYNTIKGMYGTGKDALFGQAASGSGPNSVAATRGLIGAGGDYNWDGSWTHGALDGQAATDTAPASRGLVGAGGSYSPEAGYFAAGGRAHFDDGGYMGDVQPNQPPQLQKPTPPPQQQQKSGGMGGLGGGGMMGMLARGGRTGFDSGGTAEGDQAAQDQQIASNPETTSKSGGGGGMMGMAKMFLANGGRTGFDAGGSPTYSTDGNATLVDTGGGGADDSWIDDAMRLAGNVMGTNQQPTPRPPPQNPAAGQASAARPQTAAAQVAAPPSGGLAPTAQTAPAPTQARAPAPTPLTPPPASRSAAPAPLPTQAVAPQPIASPSPSSTPAQGGLQPTGGAAVNPYAYEAATDQVESGGNPTAVNQNSGATGLDQFTSRTYLQYAAAHPQQFSGMSQDQVLATRTDPAFSHDATMWLANQNAPVLQKAGVDPTPENLYLAHQQGAGGATALLNNPNQPALAVLTGVYGDQASAEKAITQNGGNLKMTAGEFASTITGRYDAAAQKVGDSWQNGGNFPSLPAPGSAPSGLAGAGTTTSPVAQKIADTNRAETDQNTWFGKNQNWLVPVLTGLGGMASSNSRYLGSAALQGLGAGAAAYEGTQNAMGERAHQALESAQQPAQQAISEQQAQASTMGGEASLASQRTLSYVYGQGYMFTDKTTNPPTVQYLNPAQAQSIANSGAATLAPGTPPPAGASSAPTQNPAGSYDKGGNYVPTPVAAPGEYPDTRQLVTQLSLAGSFNQQHAADAQTVAQQDQASRGAQQGQTIVQGMLNDARSLPSTSLGALGSAKLDYGNKLNSVASALGLQPVVAPGDLANAEAINKGAVQLASTLASSIGGGGAEVFQDALSGVPHMGNTPAGFARLASTINQMQQYTRDTASWDDGFISKYGVIQGAQDKFAAQKPPQSYVNAAIMQAINPKDVSNWTPMVQKYANNPQALANFEASIDNIYGGGAGAVFVNSVNGKQ